MADNNQLVVQDKSNVSTGEAIPQTLNLSRLNNLKQITFIGKMMAQSGMFGDLQRDPAKAIVKIIAGQEMGIPPVEACRGLDIIQGEVAIGAGLMASKIKASPKYDYKVLKWDNDGCKLEFFERNEETGKLESQGLSEFSREDAVAAQLAHKEMYKKFPRNMFFSRAMSNGQSIYCPDIFQVGSVYTKEELDDRQVVDVPDETLIASEITAALPENTAPVVDDAPDNAPDVETSDPNEDDVDRSEVERTLKDLIADAGKMLVEKGFSREEALLIIAGIADVDDANKLSREALQLVLKVVPNETAETLALHLPGAELDESTTARIQEDYKPPTAPQPRYNVPDYKKGSTNLVRPDMIKLYKKWIKDYGLDTDEAIADMNRSIIEKPVPITFDDYLKVLTALADALNDAEAQQGALV